MKYLPGDRVEVIVDNYFVPVGTKGVVKGYGSGRWVAVEIEDDKVAKELHDCDGLTKSGRGLYLFETEIKKEGAPDVSEIETTIASGEEIPEENELIKMKKKLDSIKNAYKNFAQYVINYNGDSASLFADEKFISLKEELEELLFY